MYIPTLLAFASLALVPVAQSERVVGKAIESEHVLIVSTTAPVARPARTCWPAVDPRSTPR